MLADYTDYLFRIIESDGGTYQGWSAQIFSLFLYLYFNKFRRYKEYYLNLHVEISDDLISKTRIKYIKIIILMIVRMTNTFIGNICKSV